MQNDDKKLPAVLMPLWKTRSACLLVAVLLIVGCSNQRTLMPTPDIYAHGIMQPFADTLPAELKSVDVNIMYATDRVPDPREDGRLDYGIGREYSMAFGEAVVNIGGDISWEKLEEDARTGVRSKALDLSVVSVTERARGPGDSLVYYQEDGNMAMTAEGERKLQAMTSTVYDMIRERLIITPRKEVLIFVHGVANKFDDALYATTELWHYMGRELLPIAYSWPAGRGGLLRGYTYDRESSEFTVFHFKRFVEWLATIPEVEGIHVIAHSRGTDVVLTAIRELTIEWRGRSETALERFKLRNVVIAAPDINLEVTLQRTEREGTRWAAERWTTYTSPGDKTIGLSEWLFGGGRIGKAGYDTIDKMAKMWAENSTHVDSTDRDAVIQYDGRSGGRHGHDYFRTNPAVASDLVLAVRYGLLPGADNGRPLEYVGGLFWRIDDGYLESIDGK